MANGNVAVHHNNYVSCDILPPYLFHTKSKKEEVKEPLNGPWAVADALDSVAAGIATLSQELVRALNDGMEAIDSLQERISNVVHALATAGYVSKGLVHHRAIMSAIQAYATVTLLVIGRLAVTLMNHRPCS